MSILICTCKFMIYKEVNSAGYINYSVTQKKENNWTYRFMKVSYWFKVGFRIFEWEGL